jgi:hypothetical protein
MTASIDESLAVTPVLGDALSISARSRRDAQVTDLELVRADRLAAAQQRRSAARTRDLTALMRERPDLSGVHAPADFAVDALRWCV